MIRAGINNPENPFILLGLTEGNITRLKNGQPIRVSIESCGVQMPGQIGIIYGQTEHDIELELRQAGVFSDKTQIVRSQQQVEESAIVAEYDKILVATVGLPRSGKSTWATSQAWPIVNPDAIRLAIHGQRFNAQAEPFVWVVAKTMIQSLFLAGHKIVILDACNTTRKRRDDLRSVGWETFFKVIDTPKEICLQRAMDEQDTEIAPVIERMAAQYEPLAEDERLWPGGATNDTGP